MWRFQFFSKAGTIYTPPRPSATLFFWLVGAFLLTLIPHVEQLPAWVTASIVIAMTIRVVLEIFRLRLPGTTFTGILAICLFAAVLLQFKTIFFRDAGTAFLTGLVTIKFYEIRGPRDISLIIFSCFFVVMSSLLYSQAVELFIYCLIMMWVLTALLLRTQLGDLPQDHLLRMLGQAGLIYLQVLPLAAVLFFFFPRYSGKFPFASDEASIGLTDVIQPGSIARLSENDAEAMRVKFTGGNPPSPDTMYWRAVVLWSYREGAWVPGKISALVAEVHPKPAPGSNVVDQEITIDAHYRRWIFALDTPVTIAVNTAEGLNWSSLMRGDVLQVNGRETIDHRERYEVTSSLQVTGDSLPASSPERAFATELPLIDPRVRELADRLQRENPGTEPYILAVLHYFRQQGFVYTTSPGMEGPNALAEFLFETKKGFCEHYASAFAVLMRLENHPARVIAGYHGAEFNPYGNFYIVRQSNAHAWDEVWSETQSRWVRVDPSSVISGGAMLAATGPNPGGISAQLAQNRRFFDNGSFPDWLHRGFVEMQLRRQELEAGWDDWVFSYDPETQTRLAETLGFGARGIFIFGGICLAALLGCSLFFLSWMRRRKVDPPIESIYNRFCRAMAQRGVPRSRWEGPLAYTGRVAEAFPEKSDAIHDLGSIVAHSRYAPDSLPDAEALPRLQSLLLVITVSPATSPS